MAFQPMPLSRRVLPFDHPDWLFELKYDGFRSLAVIQNGRTQLISRNGNPFNSFADLCKGLTLPLAGKTVLDGEIVAPFKEGYEESGDLHASQNCEAAERTSSIQNAIQNARQEVWDLSFYGTQALREI
jgi:ATP-dependent DNA ligase